jgi:hypothetical protein
MARTHTHTHFFGEDDLVPLLTEAQKLRADWTERSRFMDTDLRIAGEDRLRNLDIAIRLLGDRAD